MLNFELKSFNLKLKINSVFLLFLFLCSSPSFSSVTYTKKSVEGVVLHIIEISFEKEKLVPISAQGMNYGAGLYTDQAFTAMAQSVQAVAAVNGCYFDKTNKKPIGDVAVDGARFHNGGGWACFGIKNDGTFEFGKGNPIQSRQDWSDFQMGITCLPLLIQDGVVLINTDADLRATGFRDSHIFQKMPRSAIVETKNGKILLVSSGNTYMPSFAKALKAIGAVNALGLDGGASTALYYNGKTILAAGRKLTTILAVVKNGISVKPSVKKEKPMEETPEIPQETPPSSDFCQYVDATGLDCTSCKAVVNALKQQGEAEMAKCYEKHCNEVCK